MDKLSFWRASCSRFLAYFLDQAKALQAQQEYTDKHCQNNQAERCQNTNLVSNEDEAGYFQKWQRQQEQRNKRSQTILPFKGHIRLLWIAHVNFMPI